MKPMIVFMAVSAVFLLVLVVGIPLLGGDSGRARMKAVRARREAMRRELEQGMTKTVSLRDKLAKKSSTQKLAERFRLDRMVNMDSFRAKLASAGWRNQEAVSRMLLATVLLPPLLGGYAAFMVFASPAGDHVSSAARPAVVFGAAVLGLALPWLLLKNAIVKRSQALSKQFPDALDLMLVCVEAGLSVEQSFMRVTEEIGEIIPELAEDFALTGAELALLGDRRQAYENLVARTGLPEFRSLATALVQSEKYGTSVAQALRTLSHESRQTRTNNVEKKAASLGPKMTVPMILFILPCLFLVVIGPAIINLMK